MVKWNLCIFIWWKYWFCWILFPKVWQACILHWSLWIWFYVWGNWTSHLIPLFIFYDIVTQVWQACVLHWSLWVWFYVWGNWTSHLIPLFIFYDTVTQVWQSCILHWSLWVWFYVWGNWTSHLIPLFIFYDVISTHTSYSRAFVKPRSAATFLKISSSWISFNVNYVYMGLYKKPLEYG